MTRQMKRLIGPMLLIATAGTAFGEPLDRRFGPDRERGYRSERESDTSERGFKNLDRANFLKGKPAAEADAEVARPDLQHPPTIGMQK
jgi:hypothetical protein